MWTSPITALVVVFIIAAVDAQSTEKPKESKKPGTYMISFAKRIRPGMNLDIDVKILSASSPVNLQINLVNSTDGKAMDSGLLQTVTQGVPQNIQYKIPSDLKRNSWRGYRLNFTASGGLTFTDSESLTFEEKNMSIFIQTDKAMYKPGQTVKFRIIAVDPSLKVLQVPMDVFIYDPQNNRIEQWLNVNVQNGLFEGEMVTSDDPLKGDWQIKVKSKGQEESKTFTIAEYVLPKFEANVELPSFSFVNDSNVEGKVTAKYTFGKPVNGIVNLVAHMKYYRNWWRPSNKTPPQITQKIRMVDGKADFSLNMKAIKNLVIMDNPKLKEVRLSWRSLVVKANVTETATGNKMSSSSDIQFYDNPIKMEFLTNLPRTYKPGLKYTAVLKISRQDDSPAVNPGPVSINITYDVEVPRTTTTSTTTQPTTTTKEAPSFIIPSGTESTLPLTPNRLPEISIDRLVDIMPYPHYNYPVYETRILEIRNASFDKDGLVIVTVTIPKEAHRLSFKAEGMKTSAYLSASRAYSPSENYVQLQMITPTAKVGSPAEFEFKSTEPISEFTYQVVGRGRILASKDIVTPSPSTLTTFSVDVTSDMAPNGRVVIYYKRNDDEIVADSLSFAVEGLFENEITVQFDKEKVKPGDPVKLTVRGDPGSLVNVLAVDKSVQLLKTGNDITTDVVMQEAMKYGGNYYGFIDFYYFWRWPRPGGATDAESVFRDAGLAFLTDTNLYRHENTNFYPIMYARMESAVDDAGAPQMAMNNAGGPPSNLAPVERVRKLFPETWLWQSVAIGPTGEAVVQETAPDTITTWLTSAFALHPIKGLSVANKTAKVTTFKNFFVSLNLPYSVVRGEVVLIQATVFSYLNGISPALVTIEKNPDIYNIKMQKYFLFSDYIQAEWPMTQRHYLGMMAPNSVKTTYFPIKIPNKIGKVKVKVYVQGIIGSDAVERDLLVEPEGIERSSNEPLLINMDGTSTFRETVEVVFPENTVPLSERISINIAGDILGSTLNNIDKLLKMPYGCGEQNMLNFAPGIYVTKYLRKTGRLTKEILEKATAIMKKGYQKELTYMHEDGSFSAFGERDDSGSMWLTAFVAKCFSQAYDFITIDEKIIEKSTNWMISNQRPDGSFPEPGKVFNKRMQGGSGGGETLTAYVLIALKESEMVLMAQGEEMKKTLDSVRKSIRSAQMYLEQQFPRISDPYDITIVTYALHVTNSQSASIAYNKMEQMATVASGVKFWKRPSPPEDANRPRYLWYRKNDAINIEGTAYALLAITYREAMNDGLTVLRWISRQRNPNGGFMSTQDTILAIEALSKYAENSYTPTTGLNVRVEWKDGFKVFDINSQNSLLLMSEDIPLGKSNVRIPMQFTIQAEGRGSALLEVAYSYNVEQNAVNPSFNLTTRVKEETTNSFNLEVCFSYLKSGNASMSVVEMGVPTGFEADVSTLAAHPYLTRNETDVKKLILYFDTITHDQSCVDVQMNMFDPVAKGQPVAVRIYDYYAPDDEFVMFYRRREASVCEVCPTCGLCFHWRR